MANLTWTQLSARFREIVIRAGGPEKSSSGCIDIQFDFEGKISINIGAYDIGSWSRHTDVGTFDSEEEALKALSAKLDEAEKQVTQDASRTCIECEQEIDEEGYCGCDLIEDSGN
jgi:hypothetical protein